MSGAAKASAAVEPLFSAEQIAQRVESLAGEIARAEPSEILIVSVLRGGFVFAADLVRALHRAGQSAEIDFMILSSYGGELKSSGRVAMLRDIEANVGGCSVLLVDDLVDTGRTLAFAKSLLEKRGARRVATCVLLDKAVARAIPVGPDYKGFDCPAHFVVGYGMGQGHRYRELPYIGRIMHDEADFSAGPGGSNRGPGADSSRRRRPGGARFRAPRARNGRARCDDRA